jgi:hypothetical protein
MLVTRERRQQAGLFEQPPCLVANSRPLLVGLSIAPFVEQVFSARKNSMGFAKNGPPVRRQIQKPSDHDAIEIPIGKRKPRPLGHDREHRAAATLGAQLRQHARSWIDGDDVAPACCQRDRDPPGACADVENACVRQERGGLAQAFEHGAGKDCAMAAVVDAGIPREVDAFVHGGGSCRRDDALLKTPRSRAGLRAHPHL